MHDTAVYIATAVPLRHAKVYGRCLHGYRKCISTAVTRHVQASLLILLQQYGCDFATIIFALDYRLFISPCVYTQYIAYAQAARLQELCAAIRRSHGVGISDGLTVQALPSLRRRDGRGSSEDAISRRPVGTPRGCYCCCWCYRPLRQRGSAIDQRHWSTLTSCILYRRLCFRPWHSRSWPRASGKHRKPQKFDRPPLNGLLLYMCTPPRVPDRKIQCAISWENPIIFLYNFYNIVGTLTNLRKTFDVRIAENTDYKCLDIIYMFVLCRIWICDALL